MWNNHDIARKLDEQIEHNKRAKVSKGSGCPFTHSPNSGEVGCRITVCKWTCDVLFPNWAKARDKWEKDRGFGRSSISHPCHKLTEEYVIRKCRAFVKQHLKED